MSPWFLGDKRFISHTNIPGLSELFWSFECSHKSHSGRVPPAMRESTMQWSEAGLHFLPELGALSETRTSPWFPTKHPPGCLMCIISQTGRNLYREKYPGPNMKCSVSTESKNLSALGEGGADAEFGEQGDSVITRDRWTRHGLGDKLYFLLPFLS